jgi:hypothetical protein
MPDLQNQEQNQNQNHIQDNAQDNNNIINNNFNDQTIIKTNSLNGQENENISKFAIYSMILMMIITGSINTIANKLQSISISLDKKYQHNWFITFCMFLGEMLCLFAYYGLKYFKKSNEEKSKKNLFSNTNNNTNTNNQQLSNYETSENENMETQINENKPSLPKASIYQLMLPALCDFFGSSIMTIGLGLIAGSVYQMLRGSLILFTTLFSIIFLKSKFFKHNYFGIFLVVFGLALVGVSSFKNSDKNSSNNVAYGFLLVIFAQIFTAAQFILEENFMKNYKCAPLKAIGWEGVWGSIFYIIFLIIAQNIKCPVFDSNNDFFKLICTENDKGIWLLEDSLFAFRQLANNLSLAVYCILFIFSIGIFNFVGITIAKLLSSPARAVIDTIRTIVVWSFFLLPIVDAKNQEQFMWLQLIGFLFLILGTIIYNEILILPFWGLDKEIQNKENENMENYNIYDDNENKKLIESKKKQDEI